MALYVSEQTSSKTAASTSAAVRATVDQMSVEAAAETEGTVCVCKEGKSTPSQYKHTKEEKGERLHSQTG